MQTTPQPRNRSRPGRVSSQLVGVIRRDIIRGKLKPGQFLPTEREMAGHFSVSRETARRALKVLEAEGFTIAVARRGHRVLSRGSDPDRGSPIAYVLTATHDQSWTGTQDSLLAAFQRAAGKRGWSLLVVGTPSSSPGDVLRQLRTTSVCGLALDLADPQLMALAEKAAIPAVVVNDWAESRDVDSVMQDGQHGGLLAAEHLAGRGRKRIAWLGRPVGHSPHSVDRYSGTVAGLARFGIDIPPELRAFASWDDSPARAVELLSRRDRPDAVVALWREDAWNLAAAARKLGLELGRDLDVVGWSVEEAYESEYVAGFNGGAVAPAVIWSASVMAEAVVRRLEERRNNPGLPGLRIKVPVRLKVGEREVSR